MAYMGVQGLQSFAESLTLPSPNGASANLERVAKPIDSPLHRQTTVQANGALTTFWPNLEHLLC